MYNKLQNVHICKADMFLSLCTHLFVADSKKRILKFNMLNDLLSVEAAAC